MGTVSIGLCASNTAGWDSSLGSNKPMVPTAHNQLSDYPPPRSRRHIGRPFTRSEQARSHDLTTVRTRDGSEIGNTPPGGPLPDAATAR